MSEENNNIEPNEPAVENSVENTPAEENNTPTYTKIGTEIRVVTHYLSDAEKDEYAKQAANLQRQMDDKEGIRANIFAQYVADIAAKDAEIAQLKQNVIEKSKCACTGIFEERVNCELYECRATSEIVVVPTGSDPNVAANVIARMPITTNEQEQEEVPPMEGE